MTPEQKRLLDKVRSIYARVGGGRRQLGKAPVAAPRKPRRFTPEQTRKAAAARSAKAQSRWAMVLNLSGDGASVAAAAEAVGLSEKQFRKYVRRHAGEWRWPLNS